MPATCVVLHQGSFSRERARFYEGGSTRPFPGIHLVLFIVPFHFKSGWVSVFFDFMICSAVFFFFFPLSGLFLLNCLTRFMLYSLQHFCFFSYFYFCCWRQMRRRGDGRRRVSFFFFLDVLSVSPVAKKERTSMPKGRKNLFASHAARIRYHRQVSFVPIVPFFYLNIYFSRSLIIWNESF